MKTSTALKLLAAFATTIGTTLVSANSTEDARIVLAVKNSYVYRTHLKDDPIKIQSTDGLVTLKGEVASAEHKDLARDTAENLPGVQRVDDQLTVKLADEKSDAWVAFKVKSALRYHRSVSGVRTSVSVKEGVVTLGGAASSEAQKELTAEYAQDIEGVKGVKNEMKIASEPEPPSRTMGEVIDDASITAQVKAALLTHRSTSAVKTKVATRNGVVRLAGAARNQAEKDLVAKLARDINGVRSVLNFMEVKP
jgi:osmotically-inducible protein OsmY